MTDSKKDTRTPYEPPKLFNLGDGLAYAQVVCTTGGLPGGVQCTPGGTANGGKCQVGYTAAGQCQSGTEAIYRCKTGTVIKT